MERQTRTYPLSSAPQSVAGWPPVGCVGGAGQREQLGAIIGRSDETKFSGSAVIIKTRLLLTNVHKRSRARTHTLNAMPWLPHSNHRNSESTLALAPQRPGSSSEVSMRGPRRAQTRGVPCSDFVAAKTSYLSQTATLRVVNSAASTARNDSILARDSASRSFRASSDTCSPCQGSNAVRQSACGHNKETQQARSQGIHTVFAESSSTRSRTEFARVHIASQKSPFRKRPIPERR